MKSLENFEVIYIAGYGRSGSTLLSLLLNKEEGYVNIGEAVKLFRYPNVKNYKYWENLRLASLEKTRLQDYAPKKYASYYWYLFKFDKGLKLFKTIWIDLLLEIKDHFNASVLIDASKSTRGAFARPLYYKRCNASIKVIHVMRNPRGVMQSFAKGGNRSHSKELVKAKRGGSLRALFSWFFTNAMVSIFYKKFLSKDELYVLDYDLLTRNFEKEIKRLYEFLEIDVNDSLLKEEIALSEDFSFSGNRMRLQNEITIHKSHIPEQNRITDYFINIFEYIFNKIQNNN